uniref:Hipothetical protein n=1 Tax=Xenopsylla cheopis TaxID=163159 RepID=A0A6M2DKG1_XENCH
MSNNNIADSLLGFKALLLPYSKKNTDSHYVYIKEHSVRGQTEDKPKGKTLFVLNVPHYATEDSMKRVFSEAGEVQTVIFSQKPSCVTNKTDENSNIFSSKPIVGFKVAYIVYKSVMALQKCLTLRQLPPLSIKEAPVNCGIKHWIEQYNNSIIDENIMQVEIDKFMKIYDQEENKKLQHEKSLQEADDEGWVTVTKHGRKPGFARKESVENKILQKDKAGKKRKELLNFYTFQIRESKMKHLVSLRQKFEEDKKRIALLKQSRKFKPF